MRCHQCSMVASVKIDATRHGQQRQRKRGFPVFSRARRPAARFATSQSRFCLDWLEHGGKIDGIRARDYLKQQFAG